jgi:hypothetical protein
LTIVVPRGKTDPEGGMHVAGVPALVSGVLYETAVGASAGMQIPPGHERVAETQAHEKVIASY